MSKALKFVFRIPGREERKKRRQGSGKGRGRDEETGGKGQKGILDLYLSGQRKSTSV
jgi:hypothetical protein